MSSIPTRRAGSPCRRITSRYASLSKECVVIGSVDYLEIWDAEAWQSYQETHEENFSAATDEALRDIL